MRFDIRQLPEAIRRLFKSGQRHGGALPIKLAPVLGSIAVIACASACGDGPDVTVGSGNRSPKTEGAIPAQTLDPGDTTTVNVSSYFSDPDGDALTYSTASSNANVAQVSVSDSTVTITAEAEGTATITVTATDPEGLKASQEANVTVQQSNRPPVTEGAIPAQTLDPGDTATVDASGYFSDPDGDTLIYSAAASNANVARVSVSDSTVTIKAEAEGTATITVTATDPGGLTASQEAYLTVEQSNRPPVTEGAIATQTLDPGDTATVDASGYFSDPDGDALTYSAASSNANVARVSVSGSTITIMAEAEGTATITVTATDPEGLAASQEANVTVQQSNRPPVTEGAIPAQTIDPGGTATIDASGYFSDPDGDALTYSAASSNVNVARVSVSGATVTITAEAEGTATITVTAADPEGLAASQDANVTVRQSNRSPVTEGAIPAQTVDAGSSATVNVSGYFSDPDGDVLIYSAASSNTNVAGVSVFGWNVTIAGEAEGTATITVTATDPGGLAASQEVNVTVLRPNRSPVTEGAIPAQTLNPGGTATVDASGFFSDPDGDVLTYSAASSNTNVAGVSVSGSTVTITAEAEGTATITVTATDPGGLTASQDANVTVQPPNRAPVTGGAIPDRTLDPGGTTTIDVSGYFSDPDGDALTYSAMSSNTNVARASVSGSTVTITAEAEGSTTITVTAADPEGLTASQDANVTVEQSNQSPVTEGAIPDRTLNPGATTTIEASGYFSDPDGDALTYSAASSNANVASVSVSGSTVTVTAEAEGSVTITVAATDPGGLTASQDANVTVGQGNQSPVAHGAIPARRLNLGGTTTVDATGYFSDPDGDALTYSAASSNATVARASVSGSTVTITGDAEGSATITVIATDPEGLTASQDANVTVGQSNSSPVAHSAIPAQTLNSGGTATVNASLYFSDPDGDALTYSAASSNANVAGTSVSGSTVTITAQTQGSATITVTATDPGRLTARQQFAVTVGGSSSGFNITIDYQSSASATLRTAVDAAVSTWESILSSTDFTAASSSTNINCNLSGVTFTLSAGTVIDDLLIGVAAATIDGSTRPTVLAVATLCAVRSEGAWPAFGAVLFDIDDIDGLGSTLLTSLAVHEIGHVLGIGPSSQWSGLIQGTEDPHFAGTLAIAAFDAAGGSDYTGAKVPVADDSGHWRESVLGTEMMTPFISNTNPLSAITIQALADMGYSVDVSLADAFTLSSGEAIDFARPAHTVNLHGDVVRGPVMVIDSDGNVVRVEFPEAGQ